VRDFDDLAQIVFFVVLGILWLIGKLFGKKAPERPPMPPAPLPEEVEEEEPVPPHGRPHHPRPAPPVEAPTQPRRTRVSELPSQAPPPSRRIEQWRPKPLESSRRQGHDAPLSDFDGRRALPSRTEPSDAPAPSPAPSSEPSGVSPSRLREAILWREILGPPVSRRR
jgi:hypothetical protein